MGFKARIASTVFAIAGLALAAGDARAMTLRETNLVDLIRQSDSIVLGQVTDVTDGILDNGLPYTEVTVSISERLRGDERETITFRQFGLSTPRPAGDGSSRVIPAAPEGMPRYALGEEILLFMNPAAGITGLRSPVGLGNGKFTFGPGTAENMLGNRGIFENISVERGITTANDDRILATTMGAVNDTDLKSLVRRAVSAKWVETCLMWNTEEGKTCTPHRQRKPTTIRKRETTIDSDSTTTSTGGTVLGQK